MVAEAEAEAEADTAVVVRHMAVVDTAVEVAATVPLEEAVIVVVIALVGLVTARTKSRVGPRGRGTR